MLWPGLQKGSDAYHPKSRVFEKRSGGYQESVWVLGDAELTVRAFSVHDTRTDSTLNYFNNQQLSIAIPKVIFSTEYPYDEYEDIVRHIMVTTRLHGDTLTARWPEMEMTLKRECATQAAAICKEFASFTSPRDKGICGVDGQHVDCPMLTPFGAKAYRPLDLLKNLEDITGDSDGPMVFEPYLNLDDLLVDAVGNIIAVSDLGFGAYGPRGYIRTSRHFERGATLAVARDAGWDWANLFEEELAKAGFPIHDPEALEAWLDETVEAYRAAVDADAAGGGRLCGTFLPSLRTQDGSV